VIILNQTFLQRNSPETLLHKLIKTRYGTLYSGLDVWRKAALFQSTFFFSLRLIYAFTVCFISSFGLQLHLMIVFSGFQTVYIMWVKPYIGREIFDEN
jgi:hypothetical protein